MKGANVAVYLNLQLATKGKSADHSYEEYRPQSCVTANKKMYLF